MRFLFFVLTVFFLAACASVPGGSSGTLEQRVTERWALLIQGKLADAYGYLSPASRDVISLDKYQGSIKPGIWRGAEVGKVSCASETLCTVEVNVSYVFKPKGASVHEGVRMVPETWKKDAGRWWYIPDQ